jgi:hypothetical protein
MPGGPCPADHMPVRLTQPTYVCKPRSSDKKRAPSRKRPRSSKRKPTTGTRKKVARRCARGTRRDKRTGKCMPKNDPKVTELTSETPFVDKEIGRAVADLVSEGELKTQGKPGFVQKAVPKIRGKMVTAHSYSPAANKRLASLTPDPGGPLFGCPTEGWEEAFLPVGPAKTGRRRLRTFAPQVQIGWDAPGKPKCVASTALAAQKVLLGSLAKGYKLDCSRVVPPVQARSNCWFNTMFMVFFVGDRGRKFFRAFRELMIKGRLANGDPIQPPRLRQAFSILNLCIEASHNRANDRVTKDLGLALDTNNMIERIYQAIPAHKRKLYPAITGTGSANNPLEYYQDIVSYLGQSDVTIVKIQGLDAYRRWQRGRAPAEFAADVYCIEIWGDPKLERTVETGGRAYELDAAVVLDTDKRHFCALLKCGGSEMGYDGASFGRMVPFNWTSKLGSTARWTFKGSVWSTTKEQIYWSFSGGYYLLFYFRVR